VGVRASELPESVSHAVLEVDESLLIDHEEVATVEEHVTFDQDVPQDLPLCLLEIARVAVERGVLGDLHDQQPRLTFREGKEGWKPVSDHLGPGECHLRAPLGARG